MITPKYQIVSHTIFTARPPLLSTCIFDLLTFSSSWNPPLQKNHTYLLVNCSTKFLCEDCSPHSKVKQGAMQQQKPKEVKNGNTEFNLMRILRVSRKPYNILHEKLLPLWLYQTQSLKLFDTEHAFDSCAYIIS